MKTLANLLSPWSDPYATAALCIRDSLTSQGHWARMPGIDMTVVPVLSDLLHPAACSDSRGSSSGAEGTAICRAALVEITGCLSTYEAYVGPGPQSFHCRRN